MLRSHFVRMMAGSCAVLLVVGTAAAKEDESRKAPSANDEQSITQAQIPAAVLTAFQKAYPKAVIKGARQETENNATTVEIESVDGSQKRDVKYSLDGKTLEVEEHVDAKSMPEAIQKAIATNYPQATMGKAERILRGAVTEYELHVKSGDTTLALVVDPSGKITKSRVVEVEGKEEDESGEVDED